MPYSPEIDLESFNARRDMGKLLSTDQGRNVMGVMQEAPLNDPYLRQEIFDDRLSQSGTTYGEHSSATIPKTGRQKGVKMEDRPEQDWAALRRQEIDNAIKLQEMIVKKLGKKEPDVTLAQSRLDAMKADRERINKALNERSDLSKKFMSEEGAGGTWSGAKKKAGTDADMMKEARWQRQEFMETALTDTAKTFLEKAQKEMGVKGTIVEIRPEPPGPFPGVDASLEDLQKYEKALNRESQYLDGRTRRFQLQIDSPDSEKFGETLTVNFLAPGSTEDTSDIDMQFIVEENPAMCSELIKTFQSTAKDELGKLKLGDKSLAERFDMNPYPAGFVFRPELGSDLHFSDTYTQSSLGQKKMVDGGLALLRRLDSAQDPKKEIEKLLGDLKEPERGNMLRSVSIAAELSLQAQLDRSKALQPHLGQPPFTEQGSKLSEKMKASGEQGDPTMWRQKETPSIDDIVKKVQHSQELAETMHDIEGLPGGKQLVAEARNEVYLNSLKRVEDLTVQRDQAVSSLAKHVVTLEKAMKELDDELTKIDQLLEKNPDDPTLLLQRQEGMDDHDAARERHKMALQEMRDQTSEIGVESFMAQGVALHHADEAYTNRGAIGHVVEQQMGRKFVATSGSAISSIEANHGFVLEHIEHDLQHKLDEHNSKLTQGQQPLTLADIKGEELSKFAASVGKYAERIGQAMETVDHRSVVGQNQRDGSKKTTGIREEAPHQKLVQLGKDLASIKKGVDPKTGEAIKDPKLKTGLVTVALEKAGITNAQQFKDMLDNAVSQSWQTHLSQTQSGPKHNANVKVTGPMLERGRENLKPVQKRQQEQEVSRGDHSVRSMLGKFDHPPGKDSQLTVKKEPIKVGSLREDPRMAKFNHTGKEQEHTETVKQTTGPKKSVLH